MLKSFGAALLVLAVSLVPASQAAAGTAPAQTAAACSTRVEMPERISVDRSYREIPVTLRTSCSDIDWAGTVLYGPDGLEDGFDFDPARNGAVDYWDFYAGWTPLGTYKTRDGYAYDADFNALPFTETSTSVRLRSRAGITTTRSGNYVTVRGSVQRYSPTFDAFRPWNTIARVDAKTATGWRYVRTLDLGADGVASTRLYAPSAQTYRLRVAGQTTTWGVFSATSRR